MKNYVYDDGRFRGTLATFFFYMMMIMLDLYSACFVISSWAIVVGDRLGNKNGVTPWCDVP